MLGLMPTDDEVTGDQGLPGRDYGEVLWEPSPEVIRRARITDYRRWLAARGIAAGAARPPPRPATTTNCGSGRWTSRWPSGIHCGATSRCSVSGETARCWPAGRCPR